MQQHMQAGRNYRLQFKPLLIVANLLAQDSGLFPRAVADFQAKLKDPSSTGAIFFAVCRCVQHPLLPLSVPCHSEGPHLITTLVQKRAVSQ